MGFPCMSYIEARKEGRGKKGGQSCCVQLANILCIHIIARCVLFRVLFGLISYPCHIQGAGQYIDTNTYIHTYFPPRVYIH
jgi:hypothetical protein